jgi:hypothetical protein
MTDRSPSVLTPVHRPIRFRRAAGVGIALLVVLAGCSAGGSSDEAESSASAISTSCPATIAPWAIGTSYKVGQLVTFKGGVFSCRQAHTAEDGWFPDVVLALWLPVTCSSGGAAAPAPKPTATTPPAPPTATAPPAAPPPATGGNGSTCVGGPKFDPAGAKNVGNGHGVQFIGGQCLDAADCASGCCALPCGICSGPGAQFQAGKQGCGFGG